MAPDLKSVKITNGALHESPLRGGTVVLRGVIDSASLRQLLFDDYQREAQPMISLAKLMAAVKAGETLPDIEIGMRGQKFRSKDEDYFLQDSCYVIDGQQRVNACINILTMYPGTPVYLGALIHFETTKEWERQRFRILNSDRSKVSPNVLLRNMREDHPAIATIYKLTESTDGVFSMGGKVCWGQNMKRGQLMTATTFLKVTGLLHAHLTPGSASRVDDLAAQLDTLSEKITGSLMRDNLRTFFETIDDMWGIRNVHYRDLSPHLNSGFMWMMARLFSAHLDFWRGVNGDRLFIDAETKTKISQFPLRDPGIMELTSSAGASRNVLYGKMIEHINKGRRLKRLKPREKPEAVEADEKLTEVAPATPPLPPR